MRSFLTALQYFTRIPVPAWVGHEPGQLNRAAPYFPAVGILVGLCAAGAFYAVALVLPAPLPVLLSTVITVWMTGAFHEDGVADTFDGLGGGGTRERALSIMKDSRLGTYGTLALLFTISIKLAALNAMPVPIACAALLSAHPWSRWCALILIHRLPYVGDVAQSRAKPVVDRLRGSELALAAIPGMGPLLLCGYFVSQRSSLGAALWTGVGVVASLGTLTFLARWFVRRLGGYTGDTLGAAQQLTEAVCYLGLLATWKSF
ncbi:MAG TPA: adenosylcobinamide-GDP ribazoletransferase [Steroidobacteraceae bacterium]|jgi:adenosylcobinamide-GDP ribazoletransferase